MKRIVLFISILFSFSLYSYAQNGNPCDAGYKPCGEYHVCTLAKDCKGNNPPPPGLVLPIDSNIYFLVASGLGLGIYFLGFAGKKFPASYSSPKE
jgi:hypothetical protein